MKLIIKTVLIILIALIIYPGAFISYWFLKGAISPSYGMELFKVYQTLSTEELINKLYTIDPVGPTVSEAMIELGRRKVTEAIPHLLKYTHSWNKYRKYNAIRALGEIEDDGPSERLMEIFKADGDLRARELALKALSKIKCKDAYSYVIELARAKDPASIDMLASYANPESIELLENMKTAFKGNDIADKIYRKSIDDAIAHIKKANNVE